MSNFKAESGTIEMWLICTAIGKNHELIDKMKKNADGTYPVVFSVGGVELDFYRVAERIQKEIDIINNSINERAMQKAEELIKEKYDNLIGELIDIQERIEHQKKKFFKYEWEN